MSTFPDLDRFLALPSSRVLLDRLPVGAYACDSEGLITWYNAAAVSIWGREPRCGDPVDRFCGSFKLYDEEGTPLSHDRCWMALALHEDRAFQRCSIVIEQPGGERRHVLANVNPLRDEAGKLIGAVNVLVDVTEQRRAEQALQRNQKDLDDFFDNASVGLHWVDKEGLILRANQAELDMLGYSRDAYVGHPIAEFHADEETISEIMERLSSGETLHNREARMRHRDGSIRIVQINSNALFEDGEFIHTRCITQDITDQKRAEEALRMADRRKNEFLAILAHELRNPLAPIRNAVELLRIDGPPDPALIRSRDLIDRQVTHMTRLLDDLLDVARVTRGKLEMRPERVDLETVLSRAVEIMRPEIDAKQHTLTVRLPGDAIVLDADPIRLAQAFSNLLSNAARYSAPGGQIEVAAELLASNPESRLRVTVRDTGCGIPAGDAENLFDMFVQGSSAGKSQKGLGIGLTLTRTIVELHGGSVTGRSRDGGAGSDFCIELPLSRSEPAADLPGLATTTEVPRRILVVDDNQDAAISLGMVLERVGHEVRTAFDGQEALEAAAEFRPDAILLDIGLPGMDGYEVCRRIRQQSWGRNLQLIAVTGWGEKEHKQRAREAGFDDHLTKPVSPGVIRGLLSGWITEPTDRS